MKKYLFTLLVCLSVFSLSSVQAVEKGDFVIQPTLNLGGFGYGAYGGTNLGVTANFDYAVHEYVSVGGYVGFNSLLNSSAKYSRIGFGARGVFHFWQLIDNKTSKDLKSDKVDFYLPVHLGYHIYRFGNDFYGTNLNSGQFRAGAGLGIRYYFSPKIGIAFETGGMEMSWAKIGVAIRL
ncbi:MAG TPA: hypothetical protein VLZ75_14810 [Chitinophagales bacterium]|nr:hypothetical protein [Chitinophagales bacterium]